MQTVSRILCAAAVAGIVMNAASAEGAGVWGWLERLSGPGPFEQRFGHIGARAICPRAIALPRSDAKTDSVPVRILSTDVGSTCFYVDRADFVSRNDAFVGGTSDITATVWGFGLTTLMVRWLEVGVGFGVASFHVKATDVTVTRFTLTPDRVVLRPLRLFCPDPHGWRRSFDAIKVYYKTDVIPSTLRSADFGVAGTFREKFDAVSSWGLLIDLTELRR